MNFDIIGMYKLTRCYVLEKSASANVFFFQNPNAVALNKISLMNSCLNN